MADQAKSVTSKPSAILSTENLVKGESLYSIAWKQFRKHPLARLSLGILAVLYTLAAFADFIAPYPESFINPSATFQPPNKIRFRDVDGNFTRPFIYAMEKTLDLDPESPTAFQNVWMENTEQAYPLKLFVSRDGRRDKYVPFPINLIPVEIRQQIGLRPFATWHLFGVNDPSDRVKLYLWGSDDLGGDVFGKTLFGGRISLTIGIIGSAISIIMGLILGGLAGFFGGWVDEIIMRLVEALSAIPTIFLLLILASVFYPLGWPPTYVFIAIVVALGIIGWGGIARSVRGLVLSLREQEFALAAKALGAGNWRIINKHLLPQTFNYIIVVISLAVPGYILFESVLSFYGLGIQPPATSWGLMLNTAQSFAGVTSLTDRWWIFIPGLFIFVAIITWNILGDGLRDAFDPKSRQ